MAAAAAAGERRATTRCELRQQGGAPAPRKQQWASPVVVVSTGHWCPVGCYPPWTRRCRKRTGEEPWRKKWQEACHKEQKLYCFLMPSGFPVATECLVQAAACYDPMECRFVTNAGSIARNRHWHQLATPAFGYPAPLPAAASPGSRRNLQGCCGSVVKRRLPPCSLTSSHQSGGFIMGADQGCHPSAQCVQGQVGSVNSSLAAVGAQPWDPQHSNRRL